VNTTLSITEGVSIYPEYTLRMIKSCGTRKNFFPCYTSCGVPKFRFLSNTPEYYTTLMLLP
jgi:hypothetical protein